MSPVLIIHTTKVINIEEQKIRDLFIQEYKKQERIRRGPTLSPSTEYENELSPYWQKKY